MADQNTGEAINKAVDAVVAVGDKISAMAPDAWQIAVRQQIIEGWIQLGAFIVFAIITYLGLRKLVQIFNDHDDPNPAIVVPLVVVGVIFGMASIICCIGFVVDGLPQLLNPEYAAAKDILSSIR